MEAFDHYNEVHDISTAGVSWIGTAPNGIYLIPADNQTNKPENAVPLAKVEVPWFISR